MLGIKLRVGLLGLLVMLLLGSYTATPAFAVGGPFCHHRALRGIGEGNLIPEASPETFTGTGTGQELTGVILAMRFTVDAERARSTGTMFDNADQCQVRSTITYERLSVAGFPRCEAKIGANNVVKLFGHQAWKWNGSRTQLEERSQAAQHRDWIFLPVELQQGAARLPSGKPFAVITISGAGCVIPINQAEVVGSATAEGLALPSRSQALEVWGTEEEQKTLGGEGRQHFWNGTEFVGVETFLEFPPRNKSKYTGSFTNRITSSQEIAYFER